MVNYAHRDVHYLREQITMLEDRNHFLESEFQRQLDKIVQDKNEQISRLIHIIDQSHTTTNEYREHSRDDHQLSGTESLLLVRWFISVRQFTTRSSPRKRIAEKITDFLI
jgi:predicted DNA-binding ribbon-helix-helix protein